MVRPVCTVRAKTFSLALERDIDCHARCCSLAVPSERGQLGSSQPNILCPRGHEATPPRAVEKHVLIPLLSVQAVVFHDNARTMPPGVCGRSAHCRPSVSTGMLRLTALLRLRLIWPAGWQCWRAVGWQVLDGSKRALDLCPDAGHGYSRSPAALPSPPLWRESLARCI